MGFGIDTTGELAADQRLHAAHLEFGIFNVLFGLGGQLALATARARVVRAPNRGGCQCYHRPAVLLPQPSTRRLLAWPPGLLPILGRTPVFGPLPVPCRQRLGAKIGPSGPATRSEIVVLIIF